MQHTHNCPFRSSSWPLAPAQQREIRQTSSRTFSSLCECSLDEFVPWENLSNYWGFVVRAKTATADERKEAKSSREGRGGGGGGEGGRGRNRNEEEADDEEKENLLTQVLIVGGGFFLECEDLRGNALTHHSPRLRFFFFFFLSGDRSRTLIPLFRPGSVHSGSTS